MTATGRTTKKSVGDVTSGVTFIDGVGFGVLDNGDDLLAAVGLDRGEALTFASTSSDIAGLGFSIVLADLEGTATLAFDIDGDLMKNPTGKTNGFVADDLFGISVENDDFVLLDFVDRKLYVDDVEVAVADTIWEHFAANDPKSLTVGAGIDSANAFALADVDIFLLEDIV